MHIKNVIAVVVMLVTTCTVADQLIQRAPIEQADLLPLYIGGSGFATQPDPDIDNPLLTATYEQFGLWFPKDCDTYLYFSPTQVLNENVKAGCIKDVIRQVEASTGVRLTAGDVLHPEVVGNWDRVMNLLPWDI